jgi:hypothetical protein
VAELATSRHAGPVATKATGRHDLRLSIDTAILPSLDRHHHHRSWHVIRRRPDGFRKKVQSRVIRDHDEKKAELTSQSKSSTPKKARLQRRYSPRRIADKAF